MNVKMKKMSASLARTATACVVLALLFAASLARAANALELTDSELDAPSDRGNNGTYRPHRHPVGRSYYDDEARAGSRGSFGLGVMLGEPTGLNAKYWMTRESALQFGLSYSFNNYFSLFGDYLYHFPAAFAATRGGSQFVPYVGVGLEAFFLNADSHHGYYYGSNSSFDLGIRVPLGIEFIPRQTPLGIWVELAPGIGIVPGTFGFVQAVIGARFYF